METHRIDCDDDVNVTSLYKKRLKRDDLTIVTAINESKIVFTR